MLHITNGDSVQLAVTGLPGDVLAWRDVLHEGPVPGGLDLEALSRVRAEFLASQGYDSEGRLVASLAHRDEALIRFREYEEVTLWFEHDLYDQLQLIQILAWFQGRDPGRTRLFLIQSGSYLGMMNPAELSALWPDRREISRGQLDLAAKAWTAFRSPDPRGLDTLAGHEAHDLPYLAGALARHLEQFPSVRDGLARTESQLLRTLDNGPLSFEAIFIADRACEERIFMGDTSLRMWLERLADCRHPLLREEGGLWHRTDAGGEVLAGQADHVRLNGIDRWLGGVHLQGNESPWRWDAVSGRLLG